MHGGGGGGYPHGYINSGYYMPNGGVIPPMGSAHYRGSGGGNDPRYPFGVGGAGMDWSRDARMQDGYPPIDNIYSRRKGSSGGNSSILPGNNNAGSAGSGADGYDRRACP